MKKLGDVDVVDGVVRGIDVVSVVRGGVDVSVDGSLRGTVVLSSTGALAMPVFESNSIDSISST